MVDPYDPEELLVCPYDPVHKVARKRFTYHLIKCRKNHNPRDYATCPFNARHVFPKPELDYHIQTCEDRGRLEIEMLHDQGVYHTKGNTDIPIADWKPPDGVETWEDDNVKVVTKVVDHIYSSEEESLAVITMSASSKQKQSKQSRQIPDPEKVRMPRSAAVGQDVFQYSLNRVGGPEIVMGRGRGRARGIGQSVLAPTPAVPGAPGRTMSGGRGGGVAISPQSVVRPSPGGVLGSSLTSPISQPAYSQYSDSSEGPVGNRVENGTVIPPMMSVGRGRGRGGYVSTPAVASSDGGDGGDGSVVKMLNGKTPSSVDMARVETTVQTSPPRKQVAVAAAAAVATSSEKDITKEIISDLQKKIRKLKKMLRQINDIEQKKQDGNQLNAEQLAKLSRREDVEVTLVKTEDQLSQLVGAV